MTRRTWLQALAGLPLVGRLVRAESTPRPRHIYFQRGLATMLGRTVLVRLSEPVVREKAIVSAWRAEPYQVPVPVLMAWLESPMTLRIDLLSHEPLPLAVNWSISEVR